MAAFVLSHVFRRSTSVISFANECLVFQFLTPVRKLYSPQFLGLDKYEEQRERVRNQFGPMKEKFQSRMHQHLTGEGQAMVFTEDLKNMVFMADNNEDIEVCLKMMKRFNQQNKELRFGTFIFGPVAMRLFYYLDLPDTALQALKDPELEGFFDQISSFHIAMDLLYKHKRYQDILDVFGLLKERQLYGSQFPRECTVLTFAACYKQNTPESYNYAIDLVKTAREVGVTIIRKGLAFVSALALNQNDPKTAMELLALTPQTNYITIRNLKLMTLADLDRLEDIFPILRSIIDRDVPIQSKQSKEICQMTLDRIQAAVDRSKEKEMKHIFEQLCRGLKEGDHMNSQTLDDILTTQIISKPSQRDREWSSFDATGGAFISATSSHRSPRGAGGKNSNVNRPPGRQRHGLQDIE